MENFKFWIFGFLAGAVILASGVAVFVFVNRNAEPSAPVANENENWEDRFFDLRDRNEVLISIFDDGFQPANIIVKKGTRLIWKNESTGLNYPVGYFIPDSKELKLNELFYYTPIEPGVYFYNSGVYGDKMKGKITVE